MAILARLWFHYGPASGWVLAERTGFRAKAIGDLRPRPISFQQNRCDVTTHDLRMLHRRIWNRRENTFPGGVYAAIEQIDRGRLNFRLERGTSICVLLPPSFIRPFTIFRIKIGMDSSEVLQADSDSGGKCFRRRERRFIKRRLKFPALTFQFKRLSL